MNYFNKIVPWGTIRVQKVRNQRQNNIQRKESKTAVVIGRPTFQGIKKPPKKGGLVPTKGTLPLTYLFNNQLFIFRHEYSRYN